MFSNMKNAVLVDDPRLARYDHLIVHCTATPPQLDVDAVWVNRLHRARGWRCCGYHAVITRDGLWQDSDDGYPTRPIGESGAHVGSCGRGWNGRSFGVALAGGVKKGIFGGKNRTWSTPAQNNFTLHQGAALYCGIRRFLKLHPQSDVVTVLGHRDLIAITGAPPKDCPSFDVDEWLTAVCGSDAWRDMI